MSEAGHAKISVIVPVRDGGAAFHRCLAALGAAEPPPDEIIVVDDASTDGSAKVAEEQGATVIALPAAGGPAHARNVGVRAAAGETLFFVDADVAIARDAVGQVARALAREPALVAVFGCYDDAPAEPNFLSQYKNLLHYYVHQTANEEASTFWAGCGAIRREAFAKMGGFDETLFRLPSIEDIELGYRLRRAGYRIRLVKALQGTHLKRWTAGSLLRADFFARALPWTRLILREGHLINDLNLRTSSRVCVVLSWVLPAALLWRWWWLAGAAAVALVALNAGLYRFFWRKRGWQFTLGAIPWHWFYYFYSGVAFAVGVLRGKVLAPASGAAHPDAS